MSRVLGAARAIAALAIGSVALGLPATATAATDYAETALNIIPSGQYGSVPPPPDAGEQAELYDGLTPLFDTVTDSDLDKFFKSEGFGVGPDGPFTREEIPRDGVDLYRDRFNVPHVYADNKTDGIWTAGWIVAEDRGLLLEQARFNARVAAIDAPGLSAIGLVTALKNFQPSEQTEAVVAQQAEALKKVGKEGEKILDDIDTYIDGINAYRDSINSSAPPWTPNDVFAVNSLKSQFLGQGGGDEPRRSEFLAGLQDRLGSTEGFSVFNDLRQFRNKETLNAIDGKYPYGVIRKNNPGSVVLDPGSYEPDPAVAPATARTIDEPPVDEASNTLMVTAEKSLTGEPLMVGGPQIGYFYPGLTYEIDMHAGRLQWRGASSAPFPGYLLIGRGEDFATTLTSAGADVIDTYAEELCGSDTQYRFKGKCREMEPFEAGTLDGEPVEFVTTVHGPVVGYGTVDGERVALAQKRSSFGSDSNDLIFNRRISNGRVSNSDDFFRAASKTPQTFNSFYMDTDDVAMYLAGKLPKRPKGVDPGLVTKGNGEWEWKGFLPKKRHPQGINPSDGIMTNWNQTTAKGFGAPDDSWGRNGSIGRGWLLEAAMSNNDEGGKWDLTGLTASMNASATQDVRAVFTVPLLEKVLANAPAPNAKTQQMLDLLVAWRSDGGSRLDIDLDGEIDDPGAAIMDTAWGGIANQTMKSKLGPQLDELDSLFSRFDDPPGGQYSGWYQYFDRDIRKLLGKPIRAPFANYYCGGGDVEQCATDIWAAIDQARQALEDAQGPDPTKWRSSATEERISFAPGLLQKTIRYTNRPS
ncbi:MAG: penicillin acylase family protein, partial [Solirubrobacterales bacterium]